MSPLPVLEVLLFGSRARGDAKKGSDWDVAVVVQDHDGSEARKTRRAALNVLADIALPDIATGFHLRPIVIPAVEIAPDRSAWKVLPAAFGQTVCWTGIRPAPSTGHGRRLDQYAGGEVAAGGDGPRDQG
jgi:hypothetical protein